MHRSSRNILIHLPDKPAGVFARITQLPSRWSAGGCLLLSLTLFSIVVASPRLVVASDPSNAAAPAVVEPPLTVDDRAHWAFQPVRRPDLPNVSDARWCLTPVDRFILARLDAAKLGPERLADRATLIRRLSFDLTGLPPTPAEIDPFLADEGALAYERLVDRLLASAAYGERSAQHWLDLARFAETDGFEHDNVRLNAWRYRDWVIAAMNRDLAYDEFLRLQLAGDELRPDDAGAAIATGFLLCGPDMPDINLKEERRHNFLNDLTGTLGSIVVGLQVGCAACHDHKYDPISQFDFYRLRAIFEPAEIFKEQALPQGDRPPPSAEVRELAAKLHAREAELRQLEERAREKLRAENPDLQPTRDDLLKSLSESENAKHAELSTEVARLRKEHPNSDVPLGRVVRELGPQAEASRLFIRGDFRRGGPEVEPGFLRIVNLSGDRVEAPRPNAATTGRRLQLADWLTRDDHPLTARVIVNRVWQQHFGRGLVESSSDFGRMGLEPTHPELLDWMASELPRRGWSLKWLHRLIVTSAVYRQASRPVAHATDDNWKRASQVDPDNRLLWHMPRQRLDGEAIRDSLLAAAGRLNPDRGGPGVRPPLPPELVNSLLKNQWIVSPGESDHYRRSIYLFVRRNLRYPLFEAFDRPDTNASCPRRNRSTIAPQALILLNSELSLAAAQDLAGLAYSQAGSDPAARVRLAYQRTLGRLPTTVELRAALKFLESQATQLRESGRPVAELALPRTTTPPADPFAAAAFTDFCLAVFNLNEFVYVD